MFDQGEGKMKKDSALVVFGIALGIGGPIGGWVISKIQEGQANVAAGGGAPADALASHMKTALSATAIGYAVCALGVVLLVAGLIARSKNKESQVQT